MKRSFIFLFSSLFPCLLSYAQETSLSNTRPILFSKPIALNWETLPFKSFNYSRIPLKNGAAIYSLPSQQELKFTLKIVLPLSIYSLTPQDRVNYGALIDLLILGGFGKQSYDEIQQELNEKAISLGTSLNSNGQIVISAQALPQDFNFVTQLLDNLIFRPQFSEEGLNLWKKQSENSFKSLLGAHSLQEQMLFSEAQANALAFGEKHYYATFLKRLSPRARNKVTVEDIKNIYSKALNSNGLNVFIAGKYTNKNFSDVSHLILKIPHLQAPIYKWLPINTLTSNDDSKIQTNIILKQDMTQSNVTLRYYFSNLGELNSIDKIKLALISEIFSSRGGIVGHDRWSKAMRIDSGISYSPHAYFDDKVLFPNTNLSSFILNFQTPNERLSEAVQLAKKTWKNFLSEGITQDELDNARTSMMNRMLASELTLFNKSDDIMNNIIQSKVPKTNPVEYSLVSLDQMKDVNTINECIHALFNKHSLPILVIMGNPNNKEISTLLDDTSIQLVHTIDFNSLVQSF